MNLLDILQQMSHLDVVLIDTAGRSQKDADRIAELRSWLDVAQPHEVHLVLASTASRSVLMSEAEEFSQIGIDRVVLTKLDEAVNFGMLVEVTHRIGRKLSFLTTGTGGSRPHRDGSTFPAGRTRAQCWRGVMTDQATRLRSIIGDELVTRRIQVDRSTSTDGEFTLDAHSTVAGTMRRSAKAIAITSGKGGWARAISR